MKISIIIPVYNSEKSLVKVNREINEYFSLRNYEYEKIFINDRSTDRSYSVLRDIALREEKKVIKVVDLKSNYGQQNAIFCGMHYATGDYIVTMDDDLQHNIFELDKLILEISNGKDLVYGIYDRNSCSYRNLGSKLTGKFFKYNFTNLNGKRVSSFRIFSKDLLKTTLKCPYKFIYLSGIMLRATDNIGNVSVEQRKRDYGKSGYNIKNLVLLFIKLNYYYSKYSVEFIKPKGSAFVINEIVNINREVLNEENNDAGSWRLSVKCN